ncbi:hypothetical protein ACWCV9_10195 [Streptomyces sp. NPDC001606]
MHRLRRAVCAALLLPLLAAAPAAAARSHASLPLGSVRSVRPGDTLAIEERRGALGRYGDTLNSRAFLAPGTLRMRDPLLTTTVTIACDTRPGTYPVVLRGAGDVGPDETPFVWARVRVAPADASARRACRTEVARLPKPALEERWAPDDPWPQSVWDVRTFRAGSRITLTDNDDEGADGDIILTSRAFTDRPVLRGAKAVLTATTTLTCDASPGLYVVYRHDSRLDEPARPWARLRITAADHCTAAPSSVGAATWTTAALLLAAAAATALALRARTRRRSGPGTGAA